jgi:hypothetical protein
VIGDHFYSFKKFKNLSSKPGFKRVKISHCDLLIAQRCPGYGNQSNVDTMIPDNCNWLVNSQVSVILALVLNSRAISLAF